MKKEKKKIAKIVLCFEHNYENKKCSTFLYSINIRSSNFMCSNSCVIRNNYDSFAIDLCVSDITNYRRSNKITVRLIEVFVYLTYFTLTV